MTGRLVVGISGATGICYGVRALELARKAGVETPGGDPGRAADQSYLDEVEAHGFRAGTVIHNCLLADRFPAGQRPVKGTLENGWPDDIRRRVLINWNTYGFPAGDGGI